MQRNSQSANLSYPETQTQSEVVFHVHNIAKVYRMGEVEVHALRSIDLDLYEGEFMVLLGASGSGKSTLLNILGGLDVPTSGQILFRNRDLTHASEAELTRFRRDCVGFIFQFYNLIPSLTARENVALVTEIVRRPMRPEAALELVGLGDRLDHFPAQLVLEALAQVNQELGTTTAVITHNAGIAAMADRVVTMRSGEIIRVQHNDRKASPGELEW
jgi:putative ABC transport system ATP-binding protein